MIGIFNLNHSIMLSIELLCHLGPDTCNSYLCSIFRLGGICYSGHRCVPVSRIWHFIPNSEKNEVCTFKR